MFAGDQDIEDASKELEVFLPESLRPLARVAFNYRWCWSADGAAMFEAIDPERWVRCGRNPRRLLSETPSPVLSRVGADAAFVGWVNRIAAELAADAARPCDEGAVSPAHPVASSRILLLRVRRACFPAHLFRRTRRAGR